MKIKKLQLSKDKIDINLQFYFFLKYTVKLKPSTQQIAQIKEEYITIVNHGTYLFVADEIYQTREFLQNLDKVFSVKDLNLKTLKTFINVTKS